MLFALSLFLSLSLSLDRHCLENPPILSSTSGKGTVHDIGGLKSYVIGHNHSKHAVILISDIYGYEAPNLRKIADKVAAAGFLAVVPDFFFGDAFVLNKTNKVKWNAAHPTDKGYEDAKPVIAALKKKGVSSIGAAGFCWGGKVAVKLASSNIIKAAVLLHPSKVTVDDINIVKTPIAILGAQLDNGLPPTLMTQFKEILTKKSKVKNFVKMFPGVSHGWTLRYNVTDKAAVKSAERAHKDMINWFSKYVK